MKKQMKTKALVLSLAMAFVMALPTMALAQEGRSAHGGLFSTNQSENNGSMLNQSNMMRDGGITTQGGLTFGDDHMQNQNPNAPLGSGLLILVAAGAGYTLLKKKEETK